MKSRLFSLKSLFIAYISFFFILFLYLNFQNLQATKRSLVELENSKILSLVQSEIPLIRDSIKFGFTKPIQESLQKLFRQENVIALQLHILNNPKNFELAKAPQQNGLHKVFNIKDKGQLLATLSITYTPKKAKEYYEKYKTKSIFTLFVLLPLLLGVLLFILKKIDSTYKLARFLQQLDPHAPQKISKLDNYFELNLITTTLNHFIDKTKATLNELNRLNQQLQESKTHLEDAQKLAKMGSWEYNIEDGSFYASQEFLRLLGLKECNWRYFLESIPDRTLFEKEIQKIQTSQHTSLITHKVITQEGKTQFFKTQMRFKKSTILGISLDVTEEMLAKKKIEFLAYHDPLTNLLNRTAFLERSKFYTELSKREQKKFAIIYMDLDNFKYINDTFGHNTGDKLLIFVSKTLRNILRETDTICRVGGDEFIILLPDIKDEKNIVKILNNIITTLNSGFTTNNHHFSVNTSIGVALFPKDGTNPEELIQYADAAMYESKRSGKNRCTFFNQHIRQSIEENKGILQDLKNTLINHKEQILLFFQPKVSLKNHTIIGAEVLSRWQHPKKGLLYPNQYIPIIERSNLIVEYDNLIIEKTFQQSKEWENTPLKDITLSVNISARQFKNRDFLVTLQSFLKKYSIHPKQIEFELTETLTMEHIEESIDILQKIKSLGFLVAIDDFGTGYSSLNYLKRLPYNTIKIDREFVKDLHIDPDDVTITKMIINLAHTLGKDVIAEGAEITEHIHILEQLGCNSIQGYYFSKPLPKEEFTEFVKNF